MTTPATERRIPWQRVPQGWIELTGFEDDAAADAWWQRYLATAPHSVDEATKAGMSAAFRAGRAALDRTPFAFAGIMPYAAPEPTAFFVGTALLPVPDDPRRARFAAGLTGLVRLDENAREETFVALDGRVGSASLGEYRTDAGQVIGVILGELPTVDADRTVFVLAAADPRWLPQLAPYAALALDSTRLVGEHESPPSYPGTSTDTQG